MLPIALRRATVVLPDRVAARPLFIDAGRVVAHEPASAWAFDLRDHLIFPGLVNAHDHLQLNNIPHLPAHVPFPNSYAWMVAFQPYFQEPAVAGARKVPEPVRLWHGGLKNLLCGATTVAHHDPWGPPLDDPAFPVRLLRGFGWSHSLGLGLQIADCRLQIGAAHSRLSRYGPPVVESFRATPADRPWIIHLAEGTDALAAAELSQLDALGCLAANTVLVHAVGLSAADVDRVIAASAAVVWCPASNLSLLGRTLNPRRLFDAGRLALGSDSRISGSRDLLDELRSAAQSSCLAPAELLRLATADAGRVLGMPDVGGLDPGQCADLVIVRDGGAPHQALLGLRRAEIRAVVRDGAPAIADPEFAGWFAACGVETVRVTLDGRPKLLARPLAWPDAVELEPGLSAEF
ncbi:MAG: amidohydrolase family protein [Roseiflexaceae bacterium]